MSEQYDSLAGSEMDSSDHPSNSHDYKQSINQPARHTEYGSVTFDLDSQVKEFPESDHGYWRNQILNKQPTKRWPTQ